VPFPREDRCGYIKIDRQQTPESGGLAGSTENTYACPAVQPSYRLAARPAVKSSRGAAQQGERCYSHVTVMFAYYGRVQQLTAYATSSCDWNLL
jgi:hypothetical protein